MTHRLSLCLAVGALALSACRGGASRTEPENYGALPAFVLTNQAGERFGSEQLRGKTWAGAFIFTRCPSVCPRMMEGMRRLQLSARTDHVPLTLVSFSVDPEYDTPEVLTHYAQRHGADLTNWVFLTGDADVIKATAQSGFKLALEGRADAGADDFGILHGTQLVLVDPELTIRGYYSTTDQDDQARLLVAARSLAP